MKKNYPNSPDAYTQLDLRMSSSSEKDRVEGKGVMSILRTGISKDGIWDVQQTAIQDYPLFTNKKICLDHNPEWLHPTNRSAGDIIGLITRAFPSEDGTEILAEFQITDEEVKTQFAQFNDAEALEHMQFSMAAQAIVEQPEEVPGQEEEDLPRKISRILQVWSVDHVFESAYGFTKTFMNYNKEGLSMKPEEIKALQDKAEKLEAENAKLKAESGESELTALKAQNDELKEVNARMQADNRKREIAAKIESSDLPKATMAKLASSLSHEMTDEQVDEAIKNEKDYIVSLGWKPAEEKEDGKEDVSLSGFGATTPVEDEKGGSDEDADMKRLYLTYKSNFMATGKSEAEADRQAKQTIYGDPFVQID